MKASLGKTLRKIRKGKQASLDSISDHHLSKSQISRFERGESEISCQRLINILDKLHISLDEFLILHNDEYTKTETFSNLIKFIRKEYSSLHIDNLLNLLSDASLYELNTLEKTMLKSIINTLDSNIKPSEHELAELTDYLFKIDKWGYYEIILLGNCIRSINYNTCFILTKEMLKNYIYSSLNNTNKKLVTQLAINCLILSIDNKNINNCTYLINEIELLLEGELYFYEQTVFLYSEGYFDFVLNPKNGHQKMKDAIMIFNLLGQHNLKSQYLEHYRIYIKKV